MDEIEHRYVEVKGLKLHVAEIGSGQSVVVFLHGFPEIWYSWRHQMIAVSNAGYLAIAPDYRGYGLSDPPPEPENAALGDLITDLLAILDALSIPKAVTLSSDEMQGKSIPYKMEPVHGLLAINLDEILAEHSGPASPEGWGDSEEIVRELHLGLGRLMGRLVFLVAKDFGAWPAYYFALLYPERVLGIITMGVPFLPPGSTTFDKHLPEGFYISRWREPGRAEADFGRLDAKTVVQNVYILFSKSEIPIAGENQEIMDLVEPDSSSPMVHGGRS
ncbi:unnamed protein product [Camellia sinensis]